MDGRWNSFIRVELNRDEFLVGQDVLQRFRPRLQVEANPGRVLSTLSVTADAGEEIDFANGREGSGVSLVGVVIVRPSERLELRADASRRWLNVSDAAGETSRLFVAEVERLRATWSFSSRSFLRLIGQYGQTRRDVSLYTYPETGNTAALNASALFAYKLNWQTVLYAGYGDAREYHDPTERLEPMGQQAFAKLSYAWQK